ncbi:ECs_2282 family putative zinc-binding protein [Pseudocitrobacter cyperus]|uniref:Uncharacterized protein n=1 Tax=Pseudocitrobacter cyperus TaxID=3112843 RepID=A0ABV0HE23_9ENTR
MTLRNTMQVRTYFCPACQQPIFKPGTVIYTPEEISGCNCKQCGRAYTPEDVINQARKAAAELLQSALHTGE